jgi:hypothetical protein
MTEFLVFGSVAHPRGGYTPKDIDLVVPEFTEDKPASIELERYEQLAHTTGKSVDLFLTAYSDNFNVAGWYEPGGRWQFRQAFCGKYFFDGLIPMTFEEVVEAAKVLDVNPDTMPPMKVLSPISPEGEP